MRIAPLPAVNYSFDASLKTITFLVAGGIAKPLTLAHILHITNNTQGKLIFQPQDDLTGTYNSTTGVLTLGFDTTSHDDSDQLFIVIDDGSPTQRVSAESLPLPAGAATQATLATLADRIPSQQANKIPVLSAVDATDAIGNGTRQYDFTNNVRIAVTATSTAATTLPPLGSSREVMIQANVRTFIRFGTSAVAPATIDKGQYIAEALYPHHIRIPSGVTHFTAIREAIDGNVTFTAVL